MGSAHSEGQGTGPVGHPLLTRKPLAIVAILGHLSTAVSHFDSFMWHHGCHQLHARLWRQVGNQLEPVSASSAHWHGTQTRLPERRSPEPCWRHVQRHQFPEGSDSFNAGLRKACFWDRQKHLKLFSMCLCLRMFQIIKVWSQDLRAGTGPCWVWPWVLGFRQSLDAALLPGLSSGTSGPALPALPVLGRELSAQGTPETCFA